ncbi:MAG TPA: Asp-tRNA(Asn)/Glu-tRNA(Gln) amidotransferase subunit GatC [Candidatus Eisenbacteria bacterium]|jgi:aspartyl-tRNA(Asn)/glutamyl-tRNA(Gln) amidotransferase subunit C|nr:Asp-tRNA(Asn)/Glu-tRNA(Gln) amidotransferase subunit GatC [Candidatus Eisenbacteria bacterium]
MAIDRDTVRHVALLARLELSEEEIERYARELSAVLDYVAQLDALGLEDEEPLAQVNETFPPARPDHARPAPITREEALSQAPASDGTYFLVPPVVEYLEP